MEAGRWRRVRWIPEVFARWLGGALIAISALYVWLLFELTNHSCGPLEGRTPIIPRRRLPPGPCGFHSLRFFALLGASAAVVLVPVGVWFVVYRRLRNARR